jgi:hypothetical protein
MGWMEALGTMRRYTTSSHATRVRSIRPCSSTLRMLCFKLCTSHFFALCQGNKYWLAKDEFIIHLCDSLRRFFR